MRIALIAPLMEAVPPKTYGGTERVVASLAEALTERGHQVTVFANGESHVDAELVICRDRSLLTDDRLTAEVPDHICMLNCVRRNADRFDILHFHTEFLHFPMFEDIAHKTVTTCHSRLDLVGLTAFFRRYRQFPLVSISNSQRAPLADANWMATIHHGYPLDQYRALPAEAGHRKRDDYLAFIGRIAPEKGVDDAIEIVRRSGMKLKIAARINWFDKQYWEETIRPQIDGKTITYIGEINDEQKSEFLSRASALLFPIRWPEPFGLVMIEAMACGIPVIAYPRGAVREVIDEGVTGSIVDDVAGAVAALDDLQHFDSAVIRSRFEARFSNARMAADYEKVYLRLLRAASARSRKLATLGGSHVNGAPSRSKLRKFGPKPLIGFGAPVDPSD